MNSLCHFNHIRAFRLERLDLLPSEKTLLQSFGAISQSGMTRLLGNVRVIFRELWVGSFPHLTIPTEPAVCKWSDVPAFTDQERRLEKVKPGEQCEEDSQVAQSIQSH